VISSDLQLGPDGTPSPPHVASEFYTWLWYMSDVNEQRIDLSGHLGEVEFFIDERIAFRNPSDTKVSAVITGENPAAALEAKAALLGGKVLHEIRLVVRRDDREFSVTLSGPEVLFKRLRLPQSVDGGGEEALYDRMFLHEEIETVIRGLWQLFVSDRTDGRRWSSLREEMASWAQASDVLPED
jgi:hypothetical protein